MRCLGAVLAGGEARRFGGQPKGLMRVLDATMLDRVAAAMQGVVDGPPVLVTRRDSAWAHELRGWRTVFDTREAAGPLAGIEAALEVAQAERCDGVLVVAWDMPWVTPALLRLVRERGERAQAAAVPSVGGRLEPLCAWYPVAALGEARRALDAGRRAPRDWIAALPAVEQVGEAEIALLGDPARLLASVNSPAELRAAQD